MLYVNEVSRHEKYVYSTLALGKEREIVKEETALIRKEKEAVHVHVDIQIGRHRAWIWGKKIFLNFESHFYAVRLV